LRNVILLAICFVVLAPVKIAKYSSQIIQTAIKSTVIVSAISAGSGGSGVIISQDGTVLTACHVTNCEDADKTQEEKIVIILYDGRKFDAKTIANLQEKKIAVLKIISPPDNLCFSAISEAYTHSVFTVGYPVGKRSVLFGKILNAQFLQDDFRYIQTNIPVFFGHSGGPLFNERGRIIGIAELRLTYENDEYSPEGLFTSLKTIQKNSSLLIPLEFF
jgi:S1-C subfamily serine protease